MNDSSSKKLCMYAIFSILSLSSCDDDRTQKFDGNIRMPQTPLDINLQQFDDVNLKLRFDYHVGSLKFDPANAVDLIADLNLPNKQRDSLNGIRFYALENPNNHAGYVLSSEIHNHDLTRFTPTSLPLILKHYDWGYTSQADYDESHVEFKKFLSNISSQIIALDLRYFRVPITYYDSFQELTNVSSIALPWLGVESTINNFHFPPNLNELTIYNSKINGIFNSNTYGLSKLRSLILFGCWMDGDFSFPPYNSSNNDSTTATTSIPFTSLSRQIESIELYNCDNRSFAVLMHLPWDNLKEIKFVRSFDYPPQDGIELIDCLVDWMLLSNINKFPKLESIILGFHDMNSMIDPNPRILKIDDDSQVPRWVEIKALLEEETSILNMNLNIKGLSE